MQSTSASEIHPRLFRFSRDRSQCELVEEMPQGIILAASWIRTLTCTEIAQERKRDLGFLSISARDLPVRDRSMRAVFEHSWRLLTR